VGRISVVHGAGKEAPEEREGDADMDSSGPYWGSPRIVLDFSDFADYFGHMKYPEGSSDESRVSEPRAIYVPIFDSFFESSIMREDVTTRFVFLAMIRLAWRPRSHGVVDVDPVMFAASLNIPYDDVIKAVKRLMEPDPDSGSRREDGRRIVPIDPSRPLRGWRVVNWMEYKHLLAKANDKVRKANERASKTRQDGSGQFGQNGHVTHDTIRYETKREETKEKRVRFAPPTAEEVAAYIAEKGYHFDGAAFVAYYASQSWKKANGRPVSDWRKACVTWEAREPTKVNTADAPPKPTEFVVTEFNRTMVGKNAKDYLDAYRAKFGCDPEGI
jgi:hypothetical protein